ncbi:hypothetical protein HF521_020022 [Silurus meridionalis]|uniref:Ig-like domain-containing protein n=1 Tax=Silurus meridionalis TaxID=175797 RepID=A0A8T0BI83_SILME|nr:hypothetical protein HF521_020022 [Silurus meridionalis]
MERACSFWAYPYSNLCFRITHPKVLVSLLPVAHAQERPQAVLSVSPQNWLTEGDSVTLSCEVTDSSTDWTFSCSFVTASPYLLITIILLVKCYRARAHTGEYGIEIAVIEE